MDILCISAEIAETWYFLEDIVDVEILLGAAQYCSFKEFVETRYILNGAVQLLKDCWEWFIVTDSLGDNNNWKIERKKQMK